MITSVSKKLIKSLQEKIDNKTKPVGSLGVLEDIAKQIGAIQNTLTPIIAKPTIIVFAGDHGIVNSKPISSYPQVVTQQMVLNFLSGSAAINVFCDQHNINLKVVDAGVNGELPDNSKLLKHKINLGTQDYSATKAMSSDEYQLALTAGKKIIRKIYSSGTNIVGLGEMGIGNTSSASLLMSYFTKTSIEECVGKGTGLDNSGVSNKIRILNDVYNLHHNTIETAKDALISYGGFEIVMMCGAMLEAATLQMTILIDGFIVTAALLAAHALDNKIIEYCIFSHTSGEQGHEKMLSFLGVKPILNLGMRLGEGSGVAVAFPIIVSAIEFLNKMATFKSANVSESE